jgi:hypothetical protein
MINKYNIALRVLKEMQLNYKCQYPKYIPDMILVLDIILDDIYSYLSGNFFSNCL